MKHIDLRDAEKDNCQVSFSVVLAVILQLSKYKEQMFCV